MQQQNGLSIIFYPTFPSTRKRLHIHTWPTEFESKIHNRMISNIENTKNSESSISSSSRQQQQQQQKQNQLQQLNQHQNQHQHQHQQQQQQQQHQQQQQQQQQQQLHQQEEDIEILHCDDIQQGEGSGGIVAVAGNDGFSKVPHEIMMVIMDDLDVNDIISLSMVNRKLRSHTQDNFLWRQILVKHYGESAIHDHNERLLSLNNNRKGKWKCKPKQIPTTNNWQKVYMNLSTVKIKTKTAYSRGNPSTLYRYRDFNIKDNEPSNNRLRQKQRSFNIEMTISNVPPGIYDVVWRMRIDKSFDKAILNFTTDIWLRHNIYLNSYEREANYRYSPDPDEIVKVYDKGWFYFRLPYQIVISKIDQSPKNEQSEQSDERRYQVHTGIYCYTESLAKSSSIKGPFSVDSVCLRPHIPYDHCPISNDLSHLNADNEGGSDYDYDSMDGSYSVTHNNNSNFSVIDEENDRKSKSKRNSWKALRKQHKRLSKILCV